MKAPKLQIFDCVQGSPEWFACRQGIPTASEAQTIMAQAGPKGGQKELKGRRTYMLKLIGERMTGEPTESFEDFNTQRGRKMEPKARAWYEMVSDTKVTQVGFGRRGDFGASPDSLVGDEGLLEIKTKLPHLQLECLLDGVIPSEHKAQIQWQMWVFGRQWCDFVSYWPALPGLRVRMERDEPYIENMAKLASAFMDELRATQRLFEAMAA